MFKGFFAGRAFLRSRSPLFFANRVTKPLIILQGANDPRVKENESSKHILVLIFYMRKFMYC